MSDRMKFAMGVCLVFVGVTALVSLRSYHRNDAATVSAPLSSVLALPDAATSLPASAPREPTALRTSEEPIVIPPLPANATHVPDADLLKLSALVDLPNAEERNINPEQWARAVPIAKQLVQGPCDCEQRNWLNHFIEMGQDALAGSHDAYYKLAALMPKMARNDTQLADDPGRIAR